MRLPKASSSSTGNRIVWQAARAGPAPVWSQRGLEGANRLGHMAGQDDVPGRPIILIPLFRQRHRLEREGSRIFSLIVADDVGQLAFGYPGGVADLRHRNRLAKTIHDGFDLRFVAL